jgi:hypothetical protein
VDLGPGQRTAVFAAVVVLLGALGYLLIAPALTRPHAAARPPAQRSATPAPAAPAPAQPPAMAAAGGVDIYAWLPFTEQDLADAAAVTVRFVADYDTYSYTETAAAYVAAMSGLVTGQLAATLQAGYETPGVASLRASQKQVSTGTAAIAGLRAFGPSSITFVVTARQRLVSSHGTTTGTAQYAVTVTGSGGGWRVSDIELAAAGNS